MGYRETGLMPMGLFTVDEVEVSGWPQTMVVKARAADMGQEFKQGRTQDYHNKTVSQIVGEIAQRQGLAPLVKGPVASFMYKYLSQTQESDLHFLTRLAAKHDAVGKPAMGKLLFVKKGLGLGGSASARFPDNVKAYSATFKDRPVHGETDGGWWDGTMGERKEEKGTGGGGGGVIHKLLPMFPDGIKEAQEAAQSRSDKLAREEGELEIVIIGDPSVMAETMLTVSGVRSGVDGTWRIKQVTHTIDNNGFETVIQAELPGGGGAQ
jgi:phage protein D